MKKNNCGDYIVSNAKYEKQWDGLFSYISNSQLKDQVLWKLLIAPYINKTDDFDEGWRGEYWGKLMRGGALIYAYSKDEELYRVLVEAVEGLLLTQENNGRFSSYSQKVEFTGWDMWSRKYVLLGMQYFYDICKDENLKSKMISAMQSHADYIIEKVGFGEGKKPVRETSNYHGGYNAFSILQPIVKLYKLTKDEKYLDYATKMVESEYCDGKLFALAKENKLYPYQYPITKAYEIMSCFEGLIEYYEVVGDQTYLNTARGYADKILQTDFAIIGASGGHDEYFDNSTKTQVVKTEVNKFETCVTVTLMKFLTALYRHTGDKKYLDAIEKSFYNAYLGALIDQDNTYFGLPLFYSYSPVYQNERWSLMGGGKSIAPYARFGCCIAIGAAGLGVIPTVDVVEKDGEIVVGLFIGGKYQLSTAILNLATEYPYDGAVKIELEKADTKKRIKLRIPEWCKNFTLNRDYVIEDGYAIIELSQGESVNYSMEMQYEEISSKTVNTEEEERFAVVKGPVVLCADSRETDLYKKYELAKEKGKITGRKDGDEYKFALKDGKELTLREYRFAGKNYDNPREISVWINKV
ncbi:MAG: hypothetical protein E7360_06295 [Clostridiales bacterium]|nr:hypothetical protein [Clostridiales bacterium]